jgi:putative peptidoglycan lipid II flippase
MAAGTVVSRITGLIRGLLLVAVLGTTILGDTFNVANTMPNIIYNLIIGGALTAVFVPQIVRATKDSDGGDAFISRLVTATTVLLAGLVLITTIGAPLLVRLFATGYVGRPEFNLTVSFMRYCLPQILFMGLYALLSQIANAKNKFGPMMWAPVLNNLITIVIFAWFLHSSHDLTVGTISQSQVAWLGLGTTAGFIAQALILIPVIRQTGIKISARFDWRDPSMRKSAQLATWTLAFAAISQISYLITVNLSTRAAIHALGQGITTGVGFSPYSNALLIWMLPHSVITISIVTALLPALAGFVQSQRPDLVHDQLVKAIRLVGIITVPSSVAFFLFGPIITRALFMGIPDGDAQYIGRVLAALGLGLAPMSVNLIALRGLNAFENVKLQVLSNLIMNIFGSILCVVAALTLEAKWVTVGLAAALSTSYYLGSFITLRTLRRFEVNIRIREIAGLYGKLLGASLLIGFPLHISQRHLPGGNIAHLFEVLIISGLGYLALAKLLRISEVTNLFAVLTTRKK